MQILTHNILLTILLFYTTFERVCLSLFYFHATPLTSCVALTPYLPRLKVRKEKNLLNNKDNKEVEEEVEEVCQTENFLFDSSLDAILA